MSNPQKRAYSYLLIIVLLAISVFSTSPLFAQQNRNTIVFANNLDPTTLDPHIANDAQSNIFTLAFYEGLTRWKPNSLEIEPWLAESWEVSDDGLSWTFSLRRGVLFHDGTEFNGEAVRYSIERMKAINQGLAFVLDRVESVEVVDDYTVNISLSSPDITFFQGLPGVMMVSPTTFSAQNADDNSTTFAYDNEVGTGPYKLVSWERGRRLDITKFDEYWAGWDQPHVDGYVLLVVEEPGTRRLMLEAGDIDILPKLEDQIDDVPALERNPRLVVETFPTLSNTYIVMSNHKGPLADPLVRRAVSFAFDYDAMIQVGFGGVGKQARGPLNSSVLYHDEELFQYTRDVEQAQALLAEAGYAPGELQLSFGYVGSSGVQRRTAEILQSSLADVGIELVPLPQTWPTLVASFQDPDTSPDLLNLNNHSAFPDPDYTLARFFSSEAQGTAGLNGGFYSNSEVDALIEEGRATTDPVRRAEIYERIQELMVEDAPAIWNAEMAFMVGHASYIKNIQYVPAFSRTLGYLNYIYIEN